jgi:hypothetical protein
LEAGADFVNLLQDERLFDIFAVFAENGNGGGGGRWVV